MGPYGARYPFQGLGTETSPELKNRMFKVVAAMDRYGGVTFKAEILYSPLGEAPFRVWANLYVRSCHFPKTP